MNKEDIINRFVDRPHVYITKQTYSNYVDFLSGVMLVSDINDDFLNFIKLKYETEFSVHWSYFILNEISNFNENDALDVLLSLIKEFVKTLSSDVCPNNDIFSDPKFKNVGKGAVGEPTYLNINKLNND